MNKNSRQKAARDRKEKRSGSREEVSSNLRRNMKMIVVKGTDEKGIGFSQTFHTKIYPAKPSFAKPRRDKVFPTATGPVVPSAPIPGRTMTTEEIAAATSSEEMA